MSEMRVEHDSLGAVEVPVDALWGAQTQRAIENFPISGLRMPREFIRALGLVKAACAAAHRRLGTMEPEPADAIEAAALEVAAGRHDAHFPVDVFQTGSGTSTNMNANEVIARLASARLGRPVHANDDVNRGQSSNDVIPTALHVSAATVVHRDTRPALARLAAGLRARAVGLADVVKTGRTHLMDAMPIRLDQELGAWASQVEAASRRLDAALADLRSLALGATAVGTGVNAPPGLADTAIADLARRTGIGFAPAPDRFAAIAGQDAAVAASAALEGAAVVLAKIAGDLRLMNSGPLAGLGELRLPALQPGSSIMPGKVNPVVPEAVLMACAKVVGNHATIALCGLGGQFQLNTMLPLAAHDLVQSAVLVATASDALGNRAIAAVEPDRDRIGRALARNPILATALNPRIGYDRAAAIARRAYAEERPVLDVAAEETDIPREELARILDPRRLTEPPAAPEPTR